MSARLTGTISLVLLCGACKSKPAPAPSSITDTDASTADASIVDAGLMPRIVRDGGTVARIRLNSVDAVAVSSRVDNGTESPESLYDGDLDSSWSSKTGDLVGAWVAFRFFDKVAVHGIELTVGMTKTPELFVQNVRIAEVSISWAPFIDVHKALGAETTLVDHFALDTESRALQKIPVELTGNGAVKITVTKIKPGSKPSWRETTISEIRFDDDDGHLEVSPNLISVGSFDPKPRGVLGIIPEHRVPFGCLAAFPNVPRVYCALGALGGVGANIQKSVALVSLDKDGMKEIQSLLTDSPWWEEPRIPYGPWLRIEHDLRNATTLAISNTNQKVSEVPWGGSVDADGATFRQRETMHDIHDASAGEPDYFGGVLEVKFPDAATFTKIFDSDETGTAPLVASVRKLGSMWLVERSDEKADEGISYQSAQAALCDLHAKHCTVSTEPTDVSAAPKN
ncbi:MAG: hypothetical protein ABI183_17870 [Polyangiaceae bacterium]